MILRHRCNLLDGKCCAKKLCCTSVVCILPLQDAMSSCSDCKSVFCLNFFDTSLCRYELDCKQAQKGCRLPRAADCPICHIGMPHTARQSAKSHSTGSLLSCPQFLRITGDDEHMPIASTEVRL